MSFNPISWKLLNLYFKDNPSFLNSHHLESYNDFFKSGLPQLLREKNPIHFFKNQQKITVDKPTKYVGYHKANGRPHPLTRDEMREFFPDENDEQLENHFSNWTTPPPYFKKNTIDRCDLKTYESVKNKDNNFIAVDDKVVFTFANESLGTITNEITDILSDDIGVDNLSFSNYPDF